MRPSRFLPLAFAAIAVAGCSGAATVPSPGAPTNAPAISAPATPPPTADPIASAASVPTPEVVPSATAAAGAVAGCLDKAVHAVLYKGLEDPGSLTDDDIATLRAGFEAWDPGEDEAAKSNREWFLKDGMGMVGKVAGAFMLRAGQETIEACP